MKSLLVILLFIITYLSYPQDQPYRSQYQYVKLQFSELMSTKGLFDKKNYVCYDQTGDTIKIFGVGFESKDDTTGGIDYCILATEQWKYDVYYTIKAFNLMDRAGNKIRENNTAFTFLPLVDPNNFVPKVNVNSDLNDFRQLTIDTVWASGQEDINHGPEKAIDGISYTTPGSDKAYHCWTSCCIKSPGGQWFIAGFNDIKFIKELHISGTYYYTGRVYGLRIELSNDGILWVPFQNINTLANVEWTILPVGRATKYIKIVFLSNSTPTSDWAGLWEIKLIGR